VKAQLSKLEESIASMTDVLQALVYQTSRMEGSTEWNQVGKFLMVHAKDVWAQFHVKASKDGMQQVRTVWISDCAVCSAAVTFLPVPFVKSSCSFVSLTSGASCHGACGEH